MVQAGPEFCAAIERSVDGAPVPSWEAALLLFSLYHPRPAVARPGCLSDTGLKLGSSRP